MSICHPPSVFCTLPLSLAPQPPGAAQAKTAEGNVTGDAAAAAAAAAGDGGGSADQEDPEAPVAPAVTKSNIARMRFPIQGGRISEQMNLRSAHA